MGQVKHAIHAIIDGCETYEQAVTRVEEAGLGTDNEILQGMWNSIKEFEDEDPESLGITLRFQVINIIRKEMKNRKVSQKQYAEVLECEESWLNRALRGSEDLTLDTVAKMFWCLEMIPKLTVA